MTTQGPGKDFWGQLGVLEDQHWVSKTFKGRGELEFSGRLRFSGEWVGVITATDPGSHLFVHSDSKISGLVRVERISIEGRVEDADVEAEHCHILAGARVSGRLRAKHLVVEEGAMIQGRLGRKA
jgi:cytoskeletal protein CcmA (bactofilin family)